MCLTEMHLQSFSSFFSNFYVQRFVHMNQIFSKLFILCANKPGEFHVQPNSGRGLYFHFNNPDAQITLLLGFSKCKKWIMHRRVYSDDSLMVKCLTQQLQFPTQLPLVAEQHRSCGAAVCRSSTVATCLMKRPRHQPASWSTDTCRRLSPTTGLLPTVHCWQSTMHCPDSAKWGKSLAVVYMYVIHREGRG